MRGPLQETRFTAFVDRGTNRFQDGFCSEDTVTTNKIKLN